MQKRTATCCGCSLLCHDIVVAINGSRIIEADTTCRPGVDWFTKPRQHNGGVCWVDQRPVEVESAVDAAASLLAGSSAPLICGLTNHGHQTHRAALALAGQIDAVIDWTSGCSEESRQMALQEYGEVSCSLGEIRERADLVISWFADPQATHPRFFERFASKYVAVDDQVNDTAKRAEPFFQLNEISAGAAARMLLGSLQESPDEVFSKINSEESTVQDLRILADQIRQAAYTVFVVDDGLAERFGTTALMLLYRMIRLANDGQRHCRLVRLNRQTNSVGVENALTWLSGFPFGIGFRKGQPVFRGAEFSADKLIQRQWVDLIILVGNSTQLAAYIRDSSDFTSLDKIVLNSESEDPPMTNVRVEFRAAEIGIDESDTLFRCDGVPVLVDALIRGGLPTYAEWMKSIHSKMKVKALVD